MKTQTIASHQIVDHGVDGSQYFQGCGTSGTAYDSVATGCGENASEAFQDALEQIACAESSVDLSPVEQSSDGKRFATKRAERASVERYLRSCGQLKRGQDMSDYCEENDCDLYYYVSIRYTLGASADLALWSAGLHPLQGSRPNVRAS